MLVWGETEADRLTPPVNPCWLPRDMVVADPEPATITRAAG